MRSALGIIYFVLWVFGIIVVIAQIGWGGDLATLICGLFMIGVGWFGGDMETIKYEMEELKTVRTKRKRQSEKKKPTMRKMKDAPVYEREPRVRDNY